MTRLRAEKAHLLGYKSYSEYVTSDQMAGTPEAVYARCSTRSGRRRSNAPAAKWRR